jgi:Leucine Rich repeat
LDISYCRIGDEGLCLVVDALVGNTTMKILDIRYNAITSIGLVNITRLVEFTRLQEIRTHGNYYVFIGDKVNAVQNFTRVLHNKNTSLEFLLGFDLHRFPAIRNILDRNRSMRHAKARQPIKGHMGKLT